MYGKLNNPTNLDGQLLRALVDEILAQGLEAWVSYDHGEEREDRDFVGLISDREALLDALGECDEEHLFIGKDGKELGWIFLVYGNGPGELISDYTTKANFESLLPKTFALADQHNSLTEADRALLHELLHDTDPAETARLLEENG